MADSKRSISSLSQNEKRALLVQLLEKKTNKASSPSLSVLPRPDRLPLSFAQQRIWFFDQLVTEQRKNYIYNISSAIRLQGDLQIRALEQALNEILQRHESFRTTFPLFDEQPVQMIAPSLALSLPLVNLADLPQEIQAAEVQHLAAQEARKLFNVAQGPLVRFTLLSLASNEYVLLLTLHHIIADGWSMGLLYEELSQCYEARRRGAQPQLPAPPLQYAQYALWQRAWQQAGGMESHLTYWRQRLSGAPQGLTLPYDHPRPAVQQFRGASWPLRLDEQLSQRVQQWSQQQGVSLFMTLLAAWKVVLWQYSGQSDLIVGTPIANRRQQEVEKVMGCFVNTLALRTELGGNPSFEEVVQRVREVTLEAYEHQEVPFEQMVQELHLNRDTALNPLFQVMFTLQNPLIGYLGQNHVGVEAQSIETGTAKFDLTLFLKIVEGGLQGAFEYDASLFERETIQQMGKQFERVLIQAMDAPQARLADLPLPEEGTVKLRGMFQPSQDGMALPVMSRLLPAEAGQAKQYIAPRDIWELHVTRIWEELLQVHPIGIKDNFFTLGGHSLLAATLLARLRREFGVQLPLRTLFENATIEYLALLIREQAYTQQLTPLSPLVSIQPYGSRRPFFCIHAVGGGVLSYYELAHHIGQDQPFYGLQARGVDDGQVPLATIKAMATSYIEALCTLQPQGPYLLGGWSIGGMIALEMAQQLWNNGQEVALLAMIDTPTNEELPEKQDDVELLLQIFGQKELSRDRLFQMDHTQQIHYIWEEARKKGKIAMDFTSKQILQIFNVYKANIQACKNYLPQPYPGKIVLFHASEQPARNALKPELWSSIATGGLEIFTVKGNHYSMLSQPYVQELAERLRLCLERYR